MTGKASGGHKHASCDVGLTSPCTGGVVAVGDQQTTTPLADVSILPELPKAVAPGRDGWHEP
jgi:hypothetical protein